MQLDPILVLNHFNRYFTELCDDRLWLGFLQIRAFQSLRSQLVVQNVSGTGVKQSQVIGQKGLI